MCSRFELKSKPGDLLKAFGIKNVSTEFKLQEVYPSNNVLCFNNSGPFICRWGLNVNWSKNILINARAETLLSKHTFRPFLKSKCLIPATAYFEWRHFGANRSKNIIFLKNREIFGLAGITNGESVIIITRKSSPSIAHIHDRMPIIVPKHAEKEWTSNSYPIRNSLDLIHLESDILIAEEEKHDMKYQKDLFNSQSMDN